MQFDPIKQHVERREALCKRVPPCPRCAEAHQIQLTEWLTRPASWRCRMCKLKWKHEPIDL